jgi:hypothetical protein
MSQILCWDVDYKPSSKPWSTVKCPDQKKVIDYLQQDSIILVSSEIWVNADNKDFLVLSKLHFPNIQLGIIVSRKQKSNNIVTYLKKPEIEEFIANCMRRHFQLIDHRKIIRESEELRTKN